MTPCEELGHKVGDLFKVLEDIVGFTKDQIVELNRDDKTDAPLFKGKNSMYRFADNHTSDGAFVNLAEVKPCTLTDATEK